MEKTYKSMGNEKILSGWKRAFFCSRHASPDTVLKTLDLAKEWREQGKTIVSGFHSPVEKEVLHILLKGKQPIIICPARCVENMRVPREWKKGIEEGRILVISPFKKNEKRMTSKLCDRRNEFVADMADEIFIADASKGGKIEELGKKHKDKVIYWGRK